MTLSFNFLVNLQVNCRSSFGNTNILLFLCQWLDYFLTGLFLGFIYKKIQKYLDKYFNTWHLESDWCWNDINKNNVNKII